ncbi:peroxidase 3-like [Syzygium oleosum]|uniref:peroxidase 3-like n=1 Tax=Syzygium oleosum TaxID=219896 RepID=UPI0024B9FBAD|nr:peroxidase 3-like [Syzygium oleosum]
MMMATTSGRYTLILGCVLGFLALLGDCHGGGYGLRPNFYKESCPMAEEIVKNVTWSIVAANPTVPPRMLRMHFHDCFVRGCEGSVLLNSTKNSTAEKDATPNLTLASFDVIDTIKAAVEEKCPGIVSCADILALAARDAVSFQFKEPKWDVLTGRRDGTVSLASEVSTNIPSPFLNFTALEQNFDKKGLDVRDLVVLSGAHAIGVGHCNAFSVRLYNFSGKGDQDPSLNATYATLLKSQCKNLTDNTTFVPMEPLTPLTFNNNYYVILQQHRGLFESDAALLTNATSAKITREMLNSDEFFEDFRESIKKMGAIGVLTGKSGEIRKVCSKVN